MKVIRNFLKQSMETSNKNMGLFIGAEKGYRVFQYFVERKTFPSFVLCLIEDPHEELFYKKTLSLARKCGIIAYTSDTIRSRQYKELLVRYQPECVFVVGWRFMIPPECFSIPKRGIFVFHDSLLPKYRGFAPLNWTIINGEMQTGATLFQIAEEVDSGDIVDQIEIPITGDDDACTLHKKVIDSYINLLCNNLENLFSGKTQMRKQNHRLATYACKRLPEDGHIDWSRPAREIHNLIRGLTHPYPGAFSFVNKSKFFIWQSELAKNRKRYVGRIPGRVVGVQNDGVEVLTGDDVLVLKRVQREGQKEQDAPKVLKSIKDTLH